MMHFIALSALGFFIALPYTAVSSQKNIAYCLTWDGKCEKFSVILQLFS